MVQVISKSKSGRYITFDIMGELYVLDVKKMLITSAWDGTFTVEAFNEGMYKIDVQDIIASA